MNIYLIAFNKTYFFLYFHYSIKKIFRNSILITTFLVRLVSVAPQHLRVLFFGTDNTMPLTTLSYCSLRIFLEHISRHRSENEASVRGVDAVDSCVLLTPDWFGLLHFYFVFSPAASSATSAAEIASSPASAGCLRPHYQLWTRKCYLQPFQNRPKGTKKRNDDL